MNLQWSIYQQSSQQDLFLTTQNGVFIQWRSKSKCIFEFGCVFEEWWVVEGNFNDCSIAEGDFHESFAVVACQNQIQKVLPEVD